MLQQSKQVKPYNFSYLNIVSQEHSCALDQFLQKKIVFKVWSLGCYEHFVESRGVWHRKTDFNTFDIATHILHQFRDQLNPLP